MERALTLLKHLADGAWHSGERLAAALGVSRAAVWKRLRELEPLGLTVESITGRGYRLAQPLELLDATSIRAQLSPALQATVARLDVLPVTDSTNQVLLDDSSSPALVFAEYQQAGRGRRGRQWVSPFGSNLCFSIAWEFDLPPAQLSGLSLAVGVALARQLRAEGIDGIGLKWPNDLYAKGRKLGGILIEHRGEAHGSWRSVIGVGLNYAMVETQAIAVDQPWISVQSLCAQQAQPLPTRNGLAARCAEAVLQILETFSQQGFAACQPEWQHFDLTRGATLRLDWGDRHIEGIGEGVDNEGALLLRQGDELRRYVSGELSLRFT